MTWDNATASRRAEAVSEALKVYGDSVTQSPDFQVYGDGTMYLVTPKTPQARKFVKDNIPLESWQWVGDSFAVELRYIARLITGLQGEGFIVELT